MNALRGAAFALPWIGVAVFVYVRLHFGIDFTDDAFYAALPYSFALGHRPLVDELTTVQLAGVLLAPFFRGYVELVGSNDGLVLFARHLYFALALGASAIVYGAMGEWFGRRVGAVCAALSLAYVPFLLPSPSYNVLGQLGILSGALLVAQAIRLPPRTGHLAAGIVCLAVAAFAYPPLAVAGAAALGLALLAATRFEADDVRRLTLRTLFATGGACLAAAVITVFSLGDLSDVARISEFNEAFGQQGGGFEKLLRIQAEFGLQWKLFAGLIAIWGAAWWVATWVEDSRWRIGLLAVLATLAVVASRLYMPIREPFTTTPFYIVTLGCASLVGLWRLGDRFDRSTVQAFRIVVATSWVAALVIVWMTGTGMRNSALGFAAAALMAVGWISSYGLRSGAADSLRAASGLWLLPVLAFVLFESWTHSYRDAPIRQLDAKVPSGAWAGIRTTSQTVSFLEQLGGDLEARRGEADSVLFMDYFPAGYLVTDLQPRTPAIWMFPSWYSRPANLEIREFYVRELETRDRLPDLVVQMRCMPAGRPTLASLPTPPDDPVVVWFREAGYEPVGGGVCHAILERRGGEPRP